MAIHSTLTNPTFARLARLQACHAPTAAATRVARLGGQAALLSVIYLVSSTLVELLRVPIPGNLLALLLLLGLLTTGLLSSAHVEELATFFLRHLTFFFVPFTVGLLAQGALLATAGAALLASLIVAAGVGIVVAGLAAQAASRWKGGPRATDC